MPSFHLRAELSPSFARDRDCVCSFAQKCQVVAGQLSVHAIKPDEADRVLRTMVPESIHPLSAIIVEGLIARTTKRRHLSLLTDAKDPRVTSALQFIADNVAQSTLRIAHAAATQNLSVSRLSHLLKLKTGFSWREQLTLARVNHSQHLLKHTRLTVKEIAHAVGFTQVSSFDRAFRRVTGSRPGLMREDAQER
jgi:transcriptional regulator GlxA family with amidase domain